MGEAGGKPRFVVTGVAWVVGVYLAFTAAWRVLDGDLAAAWPRAVGATLALLLCAQAFRSQAARAVGLAGSPARRRRRLPAARVIRLVAVAYLVAGVATAASHGLEGPGDDEGPAVRLGLFMGTIFASLYLWQAWWARGAGANPADEPTTTAGRALVRARRLLLEPHDIRWPRRNG